MPGQLLVEGNSYRKMLKTLVGDGKVSLAEVSALVKDARAGRLSEVEAHYLTGFLDHFANRFEPRARETLVDFVHRDLTRLAVIAPEWGGGLAGLGATGEPALARANRRDATVDWRMQRGALTVNGFGADDPLQGDVGDCYWVSALSALAQNHPEVLQRAIAPAGNHRYTVTLFQVGPRGTAPKPVALTVDLSVPSKSGQPIYMTARTPNELWPLVMEKAYAQWKGSFEDIEGGMSANAFEALTGKPAAYFPVTNDMSPAEVFRKVAKASSGGACAVALSKPFGTGMRGMVADHAYAVLGTSVREGTQWVRLRNPWGGKEPGHDGVDDGIFELKAEDFVKAMSSVEWLPKA